MNDRRDLTGVWYGRYTAEHPDVAPNSFIATLYEGGGQVSGTTSEPDPWNGDVRRADVSGRRGGAAVRFTKQYDGSGGLSHAVFYAGRINESGTEVIGSWMFEQYRGSFAMQREQFDEAELEDEETAGVMLVGRGAQD